MPPGRLPDLSVSRHFDYIPPKPPAKCRIAICKLCGGHNMAQSLDRERKHLQNKCPKYKEWDAAHSERLQTKITQHTAQPISGPRKEKLELFAFAMFKTGRPFTAFEDEAWIKFFAEFGYKPPSPSKLSDTLLNQAYKKIEAAVTLQLSASHTLNLVTNESTNISGCRIINTSAITNNSDCYYILNIEPKPGKLGAEELAMQAIKTAKGITNRDLSKVALWTTDTCAVMRSMWKKFEQTQALKHVFIAPCNSYSLQLVIKDLLKRPTIKMVFKDAL